MREDVKKRWVKALRSGKYKQGRKALRMDNKYCCLGVLCEIVGVFYEDYDIYPPDGLAGLSRAQIRDLAEKNDKLSGWWSFKRLATWIERNL